MSRKYTGSGRKREGRKGKERKHRLKFLVSKIAKVAMDGGPLLHIAKNIIKKNKDKIQKFIADEGEQEPSENPEELAVQFAQVREKKIKEIQEDGTNDANTPAEAEELFEEKQQQEIDSESYDGESDSFTEEAMGAVLGVAKGVIAKIRKKRAKKGKKTFGKLDIDTDGKGGVVLKGATDEGSTDPLSMAVKDAKKGAIETNMKQYLPIAIVLVIVIFFATRK